MYSKYFLFNVRRSRRPLFEKQHVRVLSSQRPKRIILGCLIEVKKCFSKFETGGLCSTVMPIKAQNRDRGGWNSISNCRGSYTRILLESYILDIDGLSHYTTVLQRCCRWGNNHYYFGIRIKFTIDSDISDLNKFYWKRTVCLICAANHYNCFKSCDSSRFWSNIFLEFMLIIRRTLIHKYFLVSFFKTTIIRS